MDRHQLQDAFDEIFDQVLVFHGYADYLRDYDLYIYATADPSTESHRNTCATGSPTVVARP